MTVITYDFTPSKPLIKNLDNNNKQSLNGVYASKTIQMDKVDYKAEYMYFASGIHENDRVELVIEHSAIGSNKKLFLCIPIQVQTSSPANSTSLFIKSEKDDSIPFDLAGDLPDNIQAKTYADRDNKVLVLTTPIYVSLSEGIQIPTTNLPFTSQTPNDKTIDLHPDNQIYIDCNPSGESAETIAAYNVPINSEYAKNEGKMNYERQAMYSGVFAIALVLIYFIVPWWYRTYVVESVINWMDTNSIPELKRPGKEPKYSGEVRITLINRWLMFLCGLYLLVNFTIGISSDPDLLTQTTYVAIMIALSVISIIIKGDNATFFKHDNVQLYDKVFSEGIDRELDQAIDNRATILSTLGLTSAFSVLKIEGTKWPIFYGIVLVAFLGIFYGLQYGMNSDSTSSDSSISKTFFDGIFYSTFVVMLAYMMSHYKPSESDKLKEEEPEDKGLFGNAMSGIGNFFGNIISKWDPLGMKDAYNIDDEAVKGKVVKGSETDNPMHMLTNK